MLLEMKMEQFNKEYISPKDNNNIFSKQNSHRTLTES